MIVRAPATSANLGPAFDCAAVALELWNELEVTDGDGVEVEGEGAGELPPTRRTSRSAPTRCSPIPSGKRFRFTNRIPLERGLGSSAAAIALGLAAARPDGDPEELLAAGLELESHADNLAAALVGGRDAHVGRPDRPDRRDAAARTRRVVPRERTSTEASRRALPRPSRTPTLLRTRARRAARGGAAAATPTSSPPGSTTACTSPTGRRPCSTRSAPSLPPAPAARRSPGRARP